jgi:hypothetical protein
MALPAMPNKLGLRLKGNSQCKRIYEEGWGSAGRAQHCKKRGQIIRPTQTHLQGGMGECRQSPALQELGQIIKPTQTVAHNEISGVVASQIKCPEPTEKETRRTILREFRDDPSPWRQSGGTFRSSPNCRRMGLRGCFWPRSARFFELNSNLPVSGPASAETTGKRPRTNFARLPSGTQKNAGVRPMS